MPNLTIRMAEAKQSLFNLAVKKGTLSSFPLEDEGQSGEVLTF